MAAEFLRCFTGDAEFIDRVAALIRYHMQILYVVSGLPFSDIPGMKRQTDIHEVALLGLCDRLGRAGSDRNREERNIKIFLRQCGRKI